MKTSFLSSALLGLLTTCVLALPQPVGENETYVVQEQDTIYSISRRYGLAPDHVLWANSINLSHKLKPGDSLLIPMRRIPPFTPPESTAIVLNLPERMLYLFRDHELVKFWGVAIGGNTYPTPDGTFRILAKEKNPTWEPPGWLEQEPVGPGPDNPLGDRWMQITPNMVGIHGTNNPDSIGGVASLGCVRLYPEAIRELYDQVSVGTKVYAIYEQARVGREADGTVVWSFFPDPYTKHYSTFQAREGIKEAQAEGFDGEVTDFEIVERTGLVDGLITPVFGVPVKVESSLSLGSLPALKKPTGIWLNPDVFESLGFKVSSLPSSTLIEGPQGKTVTISAQDVPLNPYRMPNLGVGEELVLEGHRWKGQTWVPFPLALEYLEIPYKWDRRKSILTLTDEKRLSQE